MRTSLSVFTRLSLPLVTAAGLALSAFAGHAAADITVVPSLADGGSIDGMTLVKLQCDRPTATDSDSPGNTASITGTLVLEGGRQVSGLSAKGTLRIVMQSSDGVVTRYEHAQVHGVLDSLGGHFFAQTFTNAATVTRIDLNLDPGPNGDDHNTAVSTAEDSFYTTCSAHSVVTVPQSADLVVQSNLQVSHGTGGTDHVRLPVTNIGTDPTLHGAASVAIEGVGTQPFAATITATQEDGGTTDRVAPQAYAEMAFDVPSGSLVNGQSYKVHIDPTGVLQFGAPDPQANDVSTVKAFVTQ